MGCRSVQPGALRPQHAVPPTRGSAIQLLVHRPHLLQGAGSGGVGLDGVLLTGLRHQLLGVFWVRGWAQRQRPAAAWAGGRAGGRARVLPRSIAKQDSCCWDAA